MMNEFHVMCQCFDREPKEIVKISEIFLSFSVLCLKYVTFMQHLHYISTKIDDIVTFEIVKFRKF